MKRERSETETLAGDEQDVDFVELWSVDLRAERRAERVRQVPRAGEEVIVLD
jgi:hypothetical protein